jgi:hypothetical protein
VDWWVAGIWGLLGGVAIELVDLYKIVRPVDASYGLPKVEGGFWLAYGIAVTIRLLIGFICGAAAADQVAAPIGALGVGAGATGFLEHLGRKARSVAAT